MKNPTLSKRHDSSEEIHEALKLPKNDLPLEAISANATEAALRVAQSLFLRASWILVIAADRTLLVAAPPA